MWKADRGAWKVEEEVKEEERESLVMMATRMREIEPLDEMGSEEVVEGDDGDGKRERKKRNIKRIVDPDGRDEMEILGQYIKDADIAQVELEQEPLTWEKEQYKKEREERPCDLEERKEERKAALKLELEKYKLFMATFLRKRKFATFAPFLVNICLKIFRMQ